MKRTFAVAAVCIALFTVGTRADATTYNYIGHAYTDYTGSGQADFGTNMTGSVTFNIDTSALTGGGPI